MVTTIIANYNYERYLKESVEACLNQTKDNFVVIGDDCSTDKSLDLALSLIKPKKIQNEKGIKIYHGQQGMVVSLPKNSGPSTVRNICIGLTLNHTEHYNIVDADDVPYKNKIEEMLKYFSKNVGLVYADYDSYNENTGILTREYKQSYSFERLHQECIIHSNFMVSKEALISVCDSRGFYAPINTAEDWDLELRIARKGWGIKHIPKSLTKVRVHDNSSISYRSSEEWNRNWNYIRETYRL